MNLVYSRPYRKENEKKKDKRKIEKEEEKDEGKNQKDETWWWVDTWADWASWLEVTSVVKRQLSWGELDKTDCSTGLPETGAWVTGSKELKPNETGPEDLQKNLWEIRK